VPAGVEYATITIAATDGKKMTVRVPIRTARAAVAAAGFIETQGVVSIEAEHFSKAFASGGRSWLRIPDHGRTLSGMTPVPVDAPPAALAADGMRLEYAMHLFTAGKIQVLATLAPTQKFQPGPGLRFAISIDDEKPQIVNMHADESRAHWSRSVSDGAVTFATEHSIGSPGAHTLKFWVVDSGLVLQKLAVNAGGLRESYLGPPESTRIP